MNNFETEKIRKDFPILSRKINGNPLIYLDNAATSQKPISVIESLSNYYSEYNSNVHRGVHTLSMEATDAYELARTKIANFINSKPEEIIWTRNTSESLNIVAKGFSESISEVNNIVISKMEHHSNLVPWQQLCIETGAELRYLENDSNGIIDLVHAQEIIDKNTSILSITHMSNVLGIINPVNELREITIKSGTKLIIDGAQSVPHFSVDVKEINCDFLSFSAHKMLGPTGIGILYGKKELLEKMNPIYFGGDMIAEVTYESATWNDLPYKFEAGTPNIADAIATGVAIDYLSNIGMDNIFSHEQYLTEYTINKFSELSNYKIIGPKTIKNRGGVISFNHKNLHPHDVGEVLDKFGIAIRTGHHCAMPLVRSYDIVAAARASFYLYNTKDEIDFFIESLIEVENYFK